MHITKLFTFIIFNLILLLCCSFITNAQSNEDCFICHDDADFTMELNGKEVSIYVSEDLFNKGRHSEFKCTVCHQNFDEESIPHNENIISRNCLSCHKKSATKHLFHPRILTASGRETETGVNCIGCHGNHYVETPNRSGNKWSTEKLPESCGMCHEKESSSYLKSEHFAAFKEGMLGAPNCLGCHRNSIAKVHTNEDSASVKISQEKLCLSCHLDTPEVRDRTAPSAGFITMYEKSIHGSELISGNPNAANCVDCHGSHQVMKSTSNSPTSKKNIPVTCGKCHNDISEEYFESVHGLALKEGVKETPICTDCHGEHLILKHDDPASPVAFQNLSNEVCSPCHSSLKLSEKYGIVTDRFKTFEDSYHGLAVEGGSLEVANCASCHGVHNIKPSSDPTSLVSKTNLIETCGKCHPGANINFTIGQIHVTREDEKEPVLYLIGTIYLALIISTVGGMFFHNAIDFYRKARIKKLKQRGFLREHHYGHSLYLRMSLNERIQHFTLAISFILLVITGFMLSYPNSWWATHIRDLSSESFEYRSLIHRISAVVMVLISVYHIYYISFTQRGKKLVKDLFPKIQDIKDAMGVLRFNVGLSDTKPKLDRFSYVEKAEYWAVIWGTIVMSATGIIMWFENTFIGLFTKLGWDIARTIHYYEAWLALLSILVWHFYFVMFNPDVYPMNLAWIKGNISEEEMLEEHPLEYEKIKNSAESDSTDEQVDKKG